MLQDELQSATSSLFNANIDLAAPFIIDKDLAEQLQPAFCDIDSNKKGYAPVLERLLPALYNASASASASVSASASKTTQSSKRQQPLEQVDYYMLEETDELIRRLHLYCQQLGIDGSTEFQIATDGSQLHVFGDFEGKAALAQRVNSDKWFVGSFNWLQPNYANLAHSFEVLEYSYCYEKSPKLAAERFAHLVREDKGLSFALKHAAGMAQAQVETPLNLYCVEGNR